MNIHRIINRVCPALFSAGMVVVLAACGQAKTAKTKSKPTVRVDVEKARMEIMEERLQTTGDVIATNTVVLESTVEGPISFCPWREGDIVDAAGKKLIVIERPLYRQELAAAEAMLAVAQAKLDDLLAGARPEEIAQARETVKHLADCTAFAKADFDRVQNLVTSGSLPAEAAEKARVDYSKCHTQHESAKEKLAMLEAGPTKTEVAIAKATVAEAAARRDLAQARLDECSIAAPFVGVITEVYVRPGDLAKPRQPLLKMMEEASLVVRAGLPEVSVMGLQVGAIADVSLDAYPGKTLVARVARIYPRLEGSSRTRLVEFSLDDKVRLLPRMFARVSLRGRRFDSAVVVPGQAVVATPRGEKIVFVIKDGKAERRIVQLGIEDAKRVQVVDGVQAGEDVVVAGNLNLKDGAVVTLGKAATAANGAVGAVGAVPVPAAEAGKKDGGR